MVEGNWVLVFSSNVSFQAEIVKQMLESNGIIATIINKRDSSYLTFGDVEVYVENDSADTARKLIEEIKI